MKFELCGKTKAKLTAVGIQSLKMGQTEVVPAIELTFKVTLANNALNMLDKTLLGFLYTKGSASANTQATLDGVEVVSDMPALSEAAVNFTVNPKKREQTGCKLYIHQGVTGDRDIKLADGTVKVTSITPKEGGAVEFEFDFYASDLDAETMGELGVLKSHELDIELTAPEVAQRSIQPEGDGAGGEAKGDGNPFPVDADKPSGDNPFGPAEALAASVAAESVPVTTKRSKLAVAK